MFAKYILIVNSFDFRYCVTLVNEKEFIKIFSLDVYKLRVFGMVAGPECQWRCVS